MHCMRRSIVQILLFIFFCFSIFSYTYIYTLQEEPHYLLTYAYIYILQKEPHCLLFFTLLT